jgi:hypothetical protein
MQTAIPRMPMGLSPSQLRQAVKLILAWEDSASLPEVLAVDLLNLFSGFVGGEQQG